jgi:hypothetical protein
VPESESREVTTRVSSAGKAVERVDLDALRRELAAHGLAIPTPTQASYDTETDDRAGWRFVLTPRWIAYALAVVVFLAIGVGTILLSVRWIVGDVTRHDVDAIDTPMAMIVGALLYLAVGVGIFIFTLREKYRRVNRLDPRLWLRELRRVQRRARKPLTDSELEDWILDSNRPASTAVDRAIQLGGGGPGSLGLDSFAPGSLALDAHALDSHGLDSHGLDAHAHVVDAVDDEVLHELEAVLPSADDRRRGSADDRAARSD